MHLLHFSCQRGKSSGSDKVFFFSFFAPFHVAFCSPLHFQVCLVFHPFFRKMIMAKKRFEWCGQLVIMHGTWNDRLPRIANASLPDHQQHHLSHHHRPAFFVLEILSISLPYLHWPPKNVLSAGVSVFYALDEMTQKN